MENGSGVVGHAGYWGIDRLVQEQECRSLKGCDDEKEMRISSAHVSQNQNLNEITSPRFRCAAEVHVPRHCTRSLLWRA